MTSRQPYFTIYKRPKIKEIPMTAPKQPFWYLAGPMTSIPQFNFPAFDRYARVLRDNGYTIVNPAELDHEQERSAAFASPDGKHTEDGTVKSWIECLKRDLVYVLDENCIGVVAMPGWEKSSGARWETDAAQRADKMIYEVVLYADVDEIQRMEPIERDIKLARARTLSHISMEKLAAEAGILLEGAWA